MDTVEDGMWWYRALHLRVLQAQGPLAGPLLDAGCGTGGFLARLKAAWPEAVAVGLERNPAAADRARTKSGAAVIVGTVNRMPFHDASFAAATSLDVLSHAMVDPPAALAELHRVLRPGGRLVLSLPAFQWLHSAHDVRVQNARRFTAPEVEGLLTAAGFREVRTSYWNSLLLPLMVARRKLVARAPESRSDVAAFPPWLDRTLFAITEAERQLARLGLFLPVGGSVLAVAVKP